MRFTTIFSLIDKWNPGAVAGEVALVVIDAFDRITSRWTASHILEKIFKVVPAFADRKATSAVIFVVGAFWVTTSLVYGLPSTVFDCSPPAVFCRLFDFQTATRSNICFDQMSAYYNGGLPTVAMAKPVGVFSGVGEPDGG